MNLDQPVEKLLAGLCLLGFGLFLFSYISDQTSKKEGRFNVYDFNVYFASITLMIGGLFFLYIGVKDLFL